MKIILLGCSLLFVVVYALKNQNTYNQRIKIQTAIYEYKIDMLNNGKPELVSYDDMEMYGKTFYRLWDWGYKKILPKDKFEIKKPYINCQVLKK